MLYTIRYILFSLIIIRCHLNSSLNWLKIIFVYQRELMYPKHFTIFSANNLAQILLNEKKKMSAENIIFFKVKKKIRCNLEKRNL